MSGFDEKRAREICEAATPGLDSPVAAPGWCWEQLADNVFEVQRCQAWSALFKRREDALFVAKARTLLPSALDEITRLRALVKEACEIGRRHAEERFAWTTVARARFKIEDDLKRLAAIRAAGGGE
jgi:hypothetical protein